MTYKSRTMSREYWARTPGHHLKTTISLCTVPANPKQHTITDILVGRDGFAHTIDDLLSDVWRRVQSREDVCKVAHGNVWSYTMTSALVKRPRGYYPRFDASRRSPSAPNDRRSLPYSASRPRTYSVSVARLCIDTVSDASTLLCSKACTHSARFTSSQVCTSTALS